MTSASLGARRTRGSLITRIALAIALVASFAVLGLQGQAHAADNGKWAAVPTQVGNSFTPRQYFIYTGVTAGGSPITDMLVVQNKQSTYLTLDLYPADAINAAGGGGYSYKKQNQKQTGVGSWVHLSTKQVTLKPGEIRRIPFTMTVPAGTTPGDHAGGIVTLDTQVTGQLPGGTGVGIQQAVGVRIYAQVAGPLTAQMQITNASLKITPATFPFFGSRGHATLTYTILNTGNENVLPSEHVVLTGLFGRTIHDLGTQPVPQVLAGQSITVTQNISGMPAFDQVHARIALVSTNASAKTAGDVLAWSISWIFVLVIVIVLACIIGAIVWRRRRKSRAGTSDSPSNRGRGRRSSSQAQEPTSVG